MQADPSKVLLLFVVFLIAIRVAFHWDLIQLSHHLIGQNNEPFTLLAKLTVLLIPLFLLWRRYKYCQRFNLLPGLKTNFGIFGNWSFLYATLVRNEKEAVAVRELADAIHFMSTQAATCDDKGIFAAWVGPAPIVYLSSPDYIREILTNHGHLTKGFFYDFTRFIIGDGLVTSAGPKWYYHRKLLTPTFHFKVLDSFMPNMKHNVGILVNRLGEETKKDNGMIHDLAKFTFPCTLDVLCESSMGININAQEDPESEYSSSFHTILAAFCDMALSPFLWLHTSDISIRLTSFGRKVWPSVLTFRKRSN